MTQSSRNHSRRQLLGALAALLVLALAARPIQAAGPGLSGFVYALDEKGKITGTVPGAVIELRGAAVVKAVADKDGRYLVDLQLGTYSYKITATGFKDENQGRKITTTRVRGGYQVQNFSLTRGKNDSGPKPLGLLDVVAGGVLQGEVVEKTVDGKEVPIRGATVSLRNTSGKSGLSQATTRRYEDKAKGRQPGSFEMALDAGTYTASVVATGFEPFKQDESITIVAGKTAPQRFVLTRLRPAPAPTGQGIVGTVKFSDSGKTTARHPPVKVSVVLVGIREKPADTFTLDGQAGFKRNLPEGRYRLVVEAKGYLTYPRTIPDVYVLRGAFTTVNVNLVPDLFFYAMVYERVGGGGRPLSGASLELVESEDPASKPESLTTDKNGYASLTVAREGSYAIRARLAGYKLAKAVNVEIRPAGENRAIIVLDRAGGALSLRVVEEYAGKKTPVAGANVTVKGKTPSRGLTAADGSYKLTGLADGEYAVAVVKKGYKLANAKAHVSQTDLIREIVLTRDIKFFDLTILAKADGKPVDGARVVVSHGRANRWGPTVAGNYRLTLAVGTYTVSVTKQGYKPAQTEVVVTDQNVTRYIDLTSETKYFDLSIRAKANGKPVQGAQVAISSGGASQSASPGVVGSYNIRLMAGTYKVSVTHQGYKPASAEIVLTNKDVIRDIELTPEANFYDLTIVAKADGKPVDGARVAVSRGTASRSGSTVAGSYKIRLRPGTYSVSVTHQGYKPARAEVVVNENVTRDIELAPEMGYFDLSIRAKAVGKPVEGAQVAVSSGGASQSGSTGGVGSYNIRLMAGTYTVSVTYKGYKPASAEIVITDQDVIRDIDLTPETKFFYLTIVAKAVGKPVDGARVVVAHGKASRSGPTVAGSYRIRLATGTYTVSVTHQGYKPAQTEVVVTDQNVTREIVLTPAANFHDLTIVAKADGKPVDRARVVLFHNTASRSGYTVAGSYKIRLKPGTYSVSVTKEGYKPAQTKVVVTNRNILREIVLTPQAYSYDLTIVVKAGGETLPDAVVYVMEGRRAVSEGTTDDSGVYKATLKPGAYTVQVSKKGFKANSRPITHDKNDSVEIVLAPAPVQPKAFDLTIVAKSGGKPVPYAEVTVWHGGTKKVGPTDEAGRFTAKGLSAGYYTVDVACKGYGGSRTPEVQISDQNVTRDVVLTPVAHFYALRILAKSGGKPVPYAEVTVRRGAAKKKVGPTDEAGSFIVKGLAAGSYTVDVICKGYTPVRIPAIVIADKNVSQEVDLVAKTFYLSILAKSGGKPVPGAEVCLMQGKKEIDVNHYTDGYGRYTAKGLREGAYILNMSKKGFKNYSSKPFTLSRSVSVVIPLTPEAYFYDLTIVAKAGGKPAPYAEVTVWLGATKKAGGPTNEAGSFTAKGLAVGSYTVNVTSKGYKPSQTSQVVIADKNVRQEVDLVRNTLQLTIVAKAGGKPVEGARVVVSRGTASREGSTVAGSYKIRLAAGTYTVSVTKPGYKPAQTQVVVADQNVLREIVLTPAAYFYDLTIVAKSRGRPVPGAEVTVWLGKVKKKEGVTDAAGSFTAKGLGVGYYTVAVNSKGYIPSRTPQVVISDKNVRQEVSLTPNVLPPGKTTHDTPRKPGPVPPKATSFNLSIVAKAGGKPVPDALVYIMEGRIAVAEGRTDGTGGYTRGLRAGGYTVQVSKKGFKANSRSVTHNKNESVEIILIPAGSGK